MGLKRRKPTRTTKLDNKYTGALDVARQIAVRKEIQQRWLDALQEPDAFGLTGKTEWVAQYKDRDDLLSSVAFLNGKWPVKKVVAKYGGYCAACREWHIEVDDVITMWATGWSDLQCVVAEIENKPEPLRDIYTQAGLVITKHCLDLLREVRRGRYRNEWDAFTRPLLSNWQSICFVMALDTKRCLTFPELYNAISFMWEYVQLGGQKFFYGWVWEVIKRYDVAVASLVGKNPMQLTPVELFLIDQYYGYAYIPQLPEPVSLIWFYSPYTKNKNGQVVSNWYLRLRVREPLSRLPILLPFGCAALPNSIDVYGYCYPVLENSSPAPGNRIDRAQWAMTAGSTRNNDDKDVYVDE